MFPPRRQAWGIIWSRTWNCQAQKPTRLEKNSCETRLLEISRLLLGKGSKANMRRISVSSDITQRRISDMPEGVRGQVINEMKTFPTPVLFVDESTDVTWCAQLLVFVRYIDSGDRSSCFVRNYKLQVQIFGRSKKLLILQNCSGNMIVASL